MKIKLCILLTLLVLSVSGSLNAQWTNQQFFRPHVAASMNSTSSVIFSCGYSGLISKSTDLGSTWVTLPNFTYFDLNDINFNAGTGYVVGQFGTVFKSTDLGSSWTNVSIPSSLTPRKVLTSFNNTVYVAADNYFYRSRNGGSSWQFSNVTSTDDASGSIDITAMWFLNQVTGFVGTEAGGIFKTLDSGATWTRQVADTVEDITDISFPNTTTGYASTRFGEILKTTNGGTNWGFISTLTSGPINSLHSSGNIVLAAGNDGEINRSTNSGASWTQYTDGSDNPFNKIGAPQGGAIITAGSEGSVSRSTNSGANWTQLYKGGYGTIQTMFFGNAATGWAADDMGHIYKTTNGGTWDTIASYRGFVFDNIGFFNSSTGWTVGDPNGDNADGTFLPGFFKTNNGGVSWNRVDISGASNIISSHFININTGWVLSTPALDAGSSSILLRTTTSGNNWSEVANINSGMNAVHFLNANTGFMAGNSRIIMKSTNGGVNWTNVFSAPPTPAARLNSIWFFDANTGYAAGDSGVVMSTTNAGNNWAYMNTGENGMLRDVKFGSPLVGCAVGWNSKRIITNDGGQTWQSEPVDFLLQLTSVSFSTPSTPVTAGQFGYISGRSIITGIEHTPGSIPDKFSLEQNYPNPFNPSTKIKFSVPIQSNVKLSIYDITGKEIAVLVNSPLRAGSYAYEFQGTDLASGVYFYRLSADEFHGTGRMVLIK